MPVRIKAAPLFFVFATEKFLDRLAKFAGESQRRADPGLIDARLNRAKRLARQSGPPRKLNLRQVQRSAPGTDGLSRHDDCHNARIMAYLCPSAAVNCPGRDFRAAGFARSHESKETYERRNSRHSIRSDFSADADLCHRSPGGRDHGRSRRRSDFCVQRNRPQDFKRRPATR